MQICRICNINKSLEDFYVTRRNLIKQKLRSECKSCSNQLHKQQYIKNKVKYLSSIKRYYNSHKKRIQFMAKNRRKSYMKSLINWFHLLKNKPCKDCSLFFTSTIMDYDHLKDKKANVSSLVTRGY